VKVAKDIVQAIDSLEAFFSLKSIKATIFSQFKVKQGVVKIVVDDGN
jgi:hypothetical protein